MLLRRISVMTTGNAVSSFSVQRSTVSHFVHMHLPVLFPALLHHVDFRWGWNYKVVKGSIPSTATWVNESSVFIGSPFITHHITHFSESVNQLLIKLRYPSLYPPVAAVFLPKFDLLHEFEWSLSYVKLLMSVFPHPIRFLTKDREHDMLCFKSAVFLEFIY